MSHLSPIPGGIYPGLYIRIRGQSNTTADRFAINLQNGPSSACPTIPFHFSVRLNQGYVARNSKRHGSWELEIGDGPLPIHKGQPFDIVIRVESDRYIVTVNGQYFCDFLHRIPLSTVDYIKIDGDVYVSGVTYESTGFRHGGVHNVIHTTYSPF